MLHIASRYLIIQFISFDLLNTQLKDFFKHDRLSYVHSFLPSSVQSLFAHRQDLQAVHMGLASGGIAS